MEITHFYLSQLKRQMLTLAEDPSRSEYARLKEMFDREYKQLQDRQREERKERQMLRQTLNDNDERLKELDKSSQRAKQERQRLKEKWQTVLQPLAKRIKELDRDLLSLYEEYKSYSRLLQQHLLQDYLDRFQPEPLPLIYHDRDIVVVDKPAGLLSVPGRYAHTQDSVLLRLKHQLQTDRVFPVHRLDQATSGLLVFALNQASLRDLTKQWQQVGKVYEALLPKGMEFDIKEGTIDFPLAPDPLQPPRQQVCPQGKPSRTDFRLLDANRLELYPHTGRTHQLRVHCLAFFGVPIWGDRLYGCSGAVDRLHLHARELALGANLHFYSPTPF